MTFKKTIPMLVLTIVLMFAMFIGIDMLVVKIFAPAGWLFYEFHALASRALGAVVGVGVGIGIYFLTEVVNIKGKSVVGWMKEGAGWVADKVTNGLNSFASQFSF